MWNSITESEFNLDIKSIQHHGGVAPLRQDLALHTYLQKRQMHAEMSRRTKFWNASQSVITKLAVQVAHASGHAVATWNLINRRPSGHGN